MFLVGSTLYTPLWVILLIIFTTLSAVLVLIWVIRWQFLNAKTWSPSECPKCGSELHRIHRTSFDRLLSQTLLPEARRYRCENPYCHWDGLRRHRREEPHRHHRTVPPEDEA